MKARDLLLVAVGTVWCQVAPLVLNWCQVWGQDHQS